MEYRVRIGRATTKPLLKAGFCRKDAKSRWESEMLLEFGLENDGAFANASAINLVASNLKEKPDGRVVNIGDVGRTQALTSALILGKNGSGKSTLVGAMLFVANFVRDSSSESNAGDKIAFDPNILVGTKSQEPTRYRVTFSMHGSIYEFEFAHNASIVTYERLQVADKSVRFRKMYERIWDKDTNSHLYTFGEALSGRRTVWQDSTRENALYLSTAARLNSEDIKPAFDWLSSYMRSINVSSDPLGGFTAKSCQKDEKFSKRVVSFLQALDINVEQIRVEEEPFDEKFFSSMFSQEFMEKFNKNLNGEDFRPSRLRVFFKKKKSDGTTVELPISNESTGTRSLFNLAGPLFDSLKNGYCLLIDEINTSLHPVIVSFLVDIFANAKINSHRAQLLFTSHDTSVLSQQRMRRDQVWLIENDVDGATLVPLSDFSPRRQEALDKGYLGGRYGGVPIVSKALLPDDLCEY